MPDELKQATAVPSYSLAERDRRWGLARSFMEREMLDALLVFSEHEDAGPAPVCFDTWFTNDRAGTTVLFPRSGDPTVFMPLPTFMIDHMESLRRRDGSWVAPGNVRLGPLFQLDRRRDRRAGVQTGEDRSFRPRALYSMAPGGHRTVRDVERHPNPGFPTPSSSP